MKRIQKSCQNDPSAGRFDGQPTGWQDIANIFHADIKFDYCTRLHAAIVNVNTGM